MSDAKAAALWGLFIGDAMAMPVHWYYRPGDIKRDYGKWLTGYMAPKDKHPTSILNLSATDGSGRSNREHSQKKSKEIVGNIILHDKRKYWQGRSDVHYHQGMEAGENTLNAMIALETVKQLQETDPEVNMEPREVRKAVLSNYVRFLTTPNSHNDTYAESCHRSFFRDLMQNDKLHKDSETVVKFCEERYKAVSAHTEDDQIPSIGALVLAIPWILHYAHRAVEDCVRNTVEALKLTHPAPSLGPYIDIYARLLHSVINGADLKHQVLHFAADPVFGKPNKCQVIQKFSSEASRYAAGSVEHLRLCQEAVGVLGMACYIQGAMASMMFLAHEFAEDFSQGVLTNTNCGGENVHRGAALAALLAVNQVNKGGRIPEELQQGLVMHEKILARLQ